MDNVALAGMVVGVVGIFCFCAVVLVLGVLAILQGQGFFGRATKGGVSVAVAPPDGGEPSDDKPA